MDDSGLSGSSPGRWRRSAALGVACVAVAAAVSVSVGGNQDDEVRLAHARIPSTSSPGGAGTAQNAGAAPELIDTAQCPSRPLALEADAVPRAALAALRAERAQDRPRILSAVLAANDAGRGGMVRRACGAQVLRRTVVVSIDLRRFRPSASLSQRVSFVARTRAGYRVFALGH